MRIKNMKIEFIMADGQIATVRLWAFEARFVSSWTMLYDTISRPKALITRATFIARRLCQRSFRVLGKLVRLECDAL